MSGDAPKRPTEKRPERGLMLGFAGLALAAFAFGMAGQLERRAAPLATSPMAAHPGFERLDAAGASTAGGTASAVFATLPGGEAARTVAPAAMCAALWDTAGTPAVGPADAPVRIAVFSATNCPFCRQLDDTLTGLRADRPDLRVVWHEWPVFGGATVLAARAALAADRQGGFEALHSRLLRTRFQPTPAYLAAVAEESGLDPDRLLADMEDPAIDAALATSAALARTFGFRGTPALVVGGVVAEGALSRAQIEALLAQEAERDDRACG